MWFAVAIIGVIAIATGVTLLPHPATNAAPPSAAAPAATATTPPGSAPAVPAAPNTGQH